MPAGAILRPSWWVGLLALAAAVAADEEFCDPMTTPEFRGVTPTSLEVLGIEYFGQREVESFEADDYMAAVAAASPRVMGPFSLPEPSVRGQPLNYVLVGDAELMTPVRVEEIKLSMQTLRDPGAPAELVADIIARSPSITWVGACVHGGETSGTDAALRLLYELADRGDCAAEQIVENQLLVILPNQNPDGRDDRQRRNANGFDMNRDWFSASQPETRGKLAVLNEYPPVLFCDIHEMGGTQYFFPPNADPYYHEVSNASVGFINDLYGAAMAEEFTRQGIPFFTKQTFDLFYAGYGDTYPTLGWNAAGMTFEQGSASPFDVKVYNQYLASWVSVSMAGIHRERVLTEWRASFVDAAAQGAAGQLQPNRVYTPGNEVEFEVPDIQVRYYFLEGGDASKAGELATVLQRLAFVGVEVLEVLGDAGELCVPDYRPYGRDPRARCFGAGTLIIPTSQGAKHYIQTMLHENTYVPLSRFYDLSGWSAPIMQNTPGGWSSATLPDHQLLPVNLSTVVSRLQAQKRATSPAAAVDRLVVGRPKKRPHGAAGSIVVLQQSNNAGESFDWLLFKLRDDWGLAYTTMLPAEFTVPGALDGADVLLVPHVTFTSVLNGLGETGQQAIIDWVARGGHYVGWQGGAQLSSALGVSMTEFVPQDIVCPGSFVRALVDVTHPLAAGVGDELFMYYRDNMPLMRSAQHRLVAFFPSGDSEDWFVSGYHEGAEELGNAVGVHQRVTGDGLVTSFAFEVNFRAFTAGTSKMIHNAILQQGRRARHNLTASARFLPRSTADRAAALTNAPSQPSWSPGRRDDGGRGEGELAVDWANHVRLAVRQPPPPPPPLLPQQPPASASASASAAVRALERNLTLALRSLGAGPPRFVRASPKQRIYSVPKSLAAGGGVDDVDRAWLGRLSHALRTHVVEPVHIRS